MTLRSHIYVVNALHVLSYTGFVGLALSLTQCNHTPRTTKDSVNVTCRTQDISGNGRTDMWTCFILAPDNTEIVQKQDLDLNNDGRIDVRKHFSQGQLTKRELDLDFDGVFDRYEFYQSGELQKVELSHSFGADIDTWQYFENGQLLRIEKDTQGNRRPDTWIFYENKRVVRIGHDDNGDGIVDRWSDM